MTPERWKQIEKLYHAALELEPARRAAFLAQACAGDESLHKEVESLLAYDGQAESFIEGAALADAAKLSVGEQAKSEEGRAKYCPQCQGQYSKTQRFCLEDGALLSLRDPYNLVSRTLADKYRLDALVGVGGMGAVYSAYQLGINRRVAFKILLPHLALANDRVVELFEREAQMAGSLSHENIAVVYDAGRTSDGLAYMVMEWLEGHTLEEALNVSGPLSLTRIAHILRQVCAALDAAHSRHIIHRDLKPSNVILVEQPDWGEQVKVLDFGIAKVITDAVGSSVSQAMGTPHYASPEQFNPGAHIDGRTDIYSLGVVLYQLLTGRLPLDAPSQQELIQLHLMAQPPSIRELRPDVPVDIEQLVLRMLAKDPERRPQRVTDIPAFFEGVLNGRDLGQEEYSSGTTTAEMPVPSKSRSVSTGKRVALLYKRHAQPDEQLLKFLETWLATHGYQVFVDRHLAIGVEWAKEIERQIRTSDTVIPLLSAASVASEMLAYEVNIAREAAEQQQGKPRLLPVRINYEKPLPEPLAAILNPIQYALWNGPQDNGRLVAELLNGMITAPIVQSSLPLKKLEPVGGAVPLDSEFYIVRPTDEKFQSAIARQDSIVLIKGARQVGKTSLLARGIQQAREAGAKVVLTDFQALTAASLASVEKLILMLAESFADQLGLDVFPSQMWNPNLSPGINFERYLRREVLTKVSSPIVWGLDEVDRLFTCDFGSEVFGLFRSWHNKRALDPTGLWQRLTLAIAYATEAHLFITDLNQSPFNVGTQLALEDFTFEQTAELNRRYGFPLREAAGVARYFHLVGGHPYLVRRGLHEIVTQGMGLTAFEALADRDEGPFGDHLRRILVLLAQDPILCDVVRGVLQGRPCPTAESFYRLRSAGVMAGDSARDVRPRCQLYATYLERHLL